ncbi:porin family protein, partial [Vibrio sp. 1974]|nr:porin family protein [Vibrio sp. 1974]
MIKKQHCLGILSVLGLSLSSFSASADFYAGALVSY